MRDACPDPASGRASQRLLRGNRIRRRAEFQSVYQRGQKIHSQSFVLYVMPNDQPCHRLGLTVSRKIGDAVVRNRVRRRLREIFRRNLPQQTPTIDLVVNAKKGIADAAYQQLLEEWTRILRKTAKSIRATT